MIGVAAHTKISKIDCPPEALLIPIILSNGKNLICPKLKQYSTEIDSGFGIADVVFYNFDEENAKNRQEFDIPRIKSFEILETLSLISKLNTASVNITQLYKKLPYSQKIFKSKILEFFFKNNIAELVDRDHISLKYHYKIALKESVAIEAKVSNWKRGLYQAYRYKQYSDFSYLALHKNYIKSPLQNIDLFKKLNIGLVSVDTNSNEVEMLYRPHKEKNHISDWVRFYANESILLDQGYIHGVSA